MKRVIRILMWVHFIYLLTLPTLAVISAYMLFPGEDYWRQLLIIGFPAVLLYSLFLASGYAIPESLPIALFQVLIVPAQIGLGVMIFGGGSIWLFFAESAAVEIGSFVFGVLTVALAERHKEASGSGFVFILILALTCFFGGALPHIFVVFYAYGSLSPWLILFVTAFATGFREHASAYRQVSAKHAETGKLQNLEMRYDGGYLFKLLRIDTDVPLICPLWKTNDKTQLNSRVHLFGWTAMFLPFAASMAMAALVLP